MKYNKLSDYDYHLPPELIAQEPLDKRDSSKMLVLNRAAGTIEHSSFEQLPAYLQKGDMLVLNDTRVIPARLPGVISGRDAAAEILLLHRLEDGDWVAMVKPGRKLKPGTRVRMELGVEALIRDYAEEEGLRIVKFFAPEPFEQLLPRLGKVPLPPYIKTDVNDAEQYQTIYAKEEGSAAAPTAGFHFTPSVFKALEEKGVERVFITLHIGPGTFQPVKAEDIREHTMHREHFRIGPEEALRLNQAREKGGRIIAVGTTSCRVLETVVDGEGIFKAAQGWTGLYIYPGFKFNAVDAMITNFHLPRSSLLMLVSALAGREKIAAAYDEAVRLQYRFFSFGDCMLIL
jgi:S-adenosylmethionine:tRNA ribosyltransferase-isomerase